MPQSGGSEGKGVQRGSLEGGKPWGYTPEIGRGFPSRQVIPEVHVLPNLPAEPRVGAIRRMMTSPSPLDSSCMKVLSLIKEKEWGPRKLARPCFLQRQ